MDADRVQLIEGDSRDAILTIADASIDSVVTDGPYALVSIVKRFGKDDAAAARAKEGGSGVYMRASAGFMGQRWDTGEVYFDVAFWREVLRVLKPGGHVVAFAGTRTYHRLVCAIEDAGFEIRDMVAWLYGSGFPKSHNVAKGIDKHLGSQGGNGEFKSARHAQSAARGRRINGVAVADRPWMDDPDALDRHARAYLPGSDAAREWEGWGTALKPALEPICLARKPLAGSVAANVLAHGTGALNIDACRVEHGDKIAPRGSMDAATSIHEGWKRPWMADGEKSKERLADAIERAESLGRWPANVVHDGSDEAIGAFPPAPGQQANISTSAPSAKTSTVYGPMKREGEASAGRRYAERGATDFAALPGARRGDEGSAARFFYSAKADDADRLGSRHPTVKPIALMRWLVRLVTPRGGVTLDPFAGTGTTGVAAIAEQCRAILIEREAQYANDIRMRLAHAAGAAPHTAQLKARKHRAAPKAGGLFADETLSATAAEG